MEHQGDEFITIEHDVNLNVLGLIYHTIYL